MKKTLIYLMAFLILINAIHAQEINYIHVNNTTFNSFGGIVLGNGEIYPGSSIRYNLTLDNPTDDDFNQQQFKVVILDPSKNILENISFFANITAGGKYEISSHLNGTDWKLIYADEPGVYKLILSTEKFQLYQKNSYGEYRHSSSLPFYFEVKSLEEKRLKDANDDLVKRNDEFAQKSMEVNEKMLDYNIRIYIVSVAMLFFAMITLFATDKAMNMFIEIIKYILIVLGILVIILLIATLLGLLIHT